MYCVKPYSTPGSIHASQPYNEIDIRPVRSKGELRHFLELPLSLHGSEPYCVPMLAFLEKMQLSPVKNPFWSHAERELFLAFRHGRPVGRIAAIIDHALDAASGQRIGGWGYFAAEDNQDTAAALFRAVEDWHEGRREGKAVLLRGPLNPSLNYAAGMLVEGFGDFPPCLTPYNPPYYQRIADACGMEKEQDLLFYRFHLGLTPENKYSGRFPAGSKYRVRYSTSSTYARDLHLLVDLYNRCWKDNWGFSPLSVDEMHFSWAAMKYLPVVSALLFLEYAGTPVGVILYGADMTPVLSRLKGRLDIAAPWHFFQGLRSITGTRMYMFGLIEEHRSQRTFFPFLSNAITHYKSFPRLEYMDAGWVLEDNAIMNQICTKLGGKVVTRSRIYRRETVHG